MDTKKPEGMAEHATPRPAPSTDYETRDANINANSGDPRVDGQKPIDWDSEAYDKKIERLTDEMKGDDK